VLRTFSSTVLQHRYPLSNSRQMKHLTATLSQLVHWCPLFLEIGFLPTLVIPFVKMFNSHNEAAFEAVVTLITNWGYHWFEMFPHPPLAHLARFEQLLQHHDSDLYEHMSHWDGSCIAPAWDLLSSLMTDVLNRNEWLKVRRCALWHAER
jgi:hypothetical protein